MSQNLISLDFTDDDLAELNAALARIESFSLDFVTLSTDEIRGLAKMGDRTEAFCRQAPAIFQQYPNAFPPSFDLAGMRHAIATLDALRAPALRLRQVLARFDDTMIALGSDIYSAALDGYAHMKHAGKSEGLDALRETFPSRRPRIQKSAGKNDS